MNASLNEKLRDVEWGKYTLRDLFISSNGTYDIQKSDINGKGYFVITSGEQNNGILGKSDVNAKIFKGGTITVDMFGNSIYRAFDYKLVTHARVFSLSPKIYITDRQGMFIASMLGNLKHKFGYGNMCSWNKIENEQIFLPIKDGKIDFEFMESFIAELESQQTTELKAYLIATGLTDYTLTDEEFSALEGFDKIQWNSFNLKKLFGPSTRGKRLKGEDRVPGDLPFVTAGEADTGISAFIGNKVEVFSANTTTIDMFGSAKYRNYEYGGDDHVAVVHTDKLEKHAAIFVTAAIEKSSHNGQFSYSRNFYAKDADALNIMLPVTGHEPDYPYMEALISAVQKLVIKDVVLYADEKIAATRQCCGK